jgi:type IV pilus assembly protein PilO
MEQLLERINKAPNQLKFGVMFGVVAALTAANYFMLIDPAEQEIESQRGQQAALERTLAEKQEIAQNLNERRKEMDELERQLLAALSELPEKKDVDELLAQLNDIGKKSGLEISGVTPGPEVPAAFFSRIPIKVSVSGNYHEVALFLQEIAGLRRIVNVNNIHLGNGVVKNDKVVLSSDFLATTFRFLDQPKAKPTP